MLFAGKGGLCLPVHVSATSLIAPLRKPEVLAPAGEWDCVRAAVENGADAVFFGVGRFNARVRAKNFEESDLPELMAYLHGRGVKGYVTATCGTQFALESRTARAPQHCLFELGWSLGCSGMWSFQY